MRFLCHIGYHTSAGATALLLGLSLCMLQTRDAWAVDPGPNGKQCQNQGTKRVCDNMCSQSPNCKGDNLCKSNGADCVNCICRIYRWGAPINMSNCECQDPAVAGDPDPLGGP